MTDDQITRLREKLKYDPETGAFTWLSRPNGRVQPGSAAGSLGSNGYLVIGFEGKVYRAHRLAFILMTGSPPASDVDHINRVRNDNRWCNLRAATKSGNCANSSMRSDNKSGCRGVVWDKRHRKWRVAVQARGRRLHVGLFHSLAEADAAAVAHRQKVFGQFTPDSVR